MDRQCYLCHGEGTREWVNHLPWDGMTPERAEDRPCGFCDGAGTVPGTNEALDRAILELALHPREGRSAQEVGELLRHTTQRAAGRLRSLARRGLADMVRPSDVGVDGRGFPGAADGSAMWYLSRTKMKRTMKRTRGKA